MDIGNMISQRGHLVDKDSLNFMPLVLPSLSERRLSFSPILREFGLVQDTCAMVLCFLCLQPKCLPWVWASMSPFLWEHWLCIFCQKQKNDSKVVVVG